MSVVIRRVVNSTHEPKMFTNDTIINTVLKISHTLRGTQHLQPYLTNTTENCFSLAVRGQQVFSFIRISGIMKATVILFVKEQLSQLWELKQLHHLHQPADPPRQTWRCVRGERGHKWILQQTISDLTPKHTQSLLKWRWDEQMYKFQVDMQIKDLCGCKCN